MSSHASVVALCLTIPSPGFVGAERTLLTPSFWVRHER
jgi:hypothetical protein